MSLWGWLCYFFLVHVSSTLVLPCCVLRSSPPSHYGGALWDCIVPFARSCPGGVAHTAAAGWKFASHPRAPYLGGSVVHSSAAGCAPVLVFVGPHVGPTCIVHAHVWNGLPPVDGGRPAVSVALCLYHCSSLLCHCRCGTGPHTCCADGAPARGPVPVCGVVPVVFSRPGTVTVRARHRVLLTLFPSTTTRVTPPSFMLT